MENISNVRGAAINRGTYGAKKKDLYWRGLVLSQYDGKTWSRNDAPVSTHPSVSNVNVQTENIEYTVMLQPHGRKWLYSLETLLNKEDTYKVTRELQVVTSNEVKSVLQYSMSSNPDVINNGLFAEERKKNLLLPTGLNQQTIAMAKKMYRQANGNVADYVNSVLSYFSSEPFYYTLSPPLLGNNAMDDFIFKSKQGFCEHYSSAFVYLMRAAGVPARVVVGYQGGTSNPVDDYMIVRQSDAHAWTEVWLDGRGWVRVDPTSAVSPDRINYGVANAGLEEARLPAFIVSNSELLNKLRFTMDSFNHSWNKWVVGFDEQKQKELFKSLGINNVDKATLFSWMVIAMTLSGALVAIWVFKYKDKKSRHDIAVYYYDIFCQKLEKAGLARNASESAGEFLERVVREFPEVKQKAGLITQCYQQIRYANDRSIKRKRQLIDAVKLFRVK